MRENNIERKCTPTPQYKQIDASHEVFHNTHASRVPAMFVSSGKQQAHAWPLPKPYRPNQHTVYMTRNFHVYELILSYVR